jgi:hypothetical protein
MELSSVQVLMKVRAVVARRERMTPKQRAQADKTLSCLRHGGAATFVRTSRRFHSLSSYWALLERAHEVRFDDSAEMVDVRRQLDLRVGDN